MQIKDDISPEVQQAKMRFSIIGNAPALTAAVQRAIKVAPIDLSVLVTGESGVGKEFFPKIIHAYSSRKHARYIAVNCGAIPEGTIDSELFGHEKGAFTGAISARKGYFEEADGGTIFLDEVAELERICFTTPWSRNMLVEELQNDCAAFLVALDDEDHVAGYAGLLVVLDEGYITNVAVRPECRRNGIAQKLLQVFLDFAQAHKLAFLTLEVRASNYGAIALYGSRGFRSVGRRKNYYEHPKEDAIIMTKEFTDGTEDPDTGAAADGL